MHPYRTALDQPNGTPHADHEQRTAATTREHFGSALAAFARLYSAAEACGDLAGAERFAAAVDILLAACPSPEPVLPGVDHAPGAGDVPSWC
jgi:hypothetical protein